MILDDFFGQILGLQSTNYWHILKNCWGKLVRDMVSNVILKKDQSYNRLIRKHRDNLAKKQCIEDNTHDIFVRLASENDPVSFEYR